MKKAFLILTQDHPNSSYCKFLIKKINACFGKIADKGTVEIIFKDICKKFILPVLLFLSVEVHSQVTVILNQPPPNQLNIADLWKLTLNNLSPNSYSVTLKATVDEATDGNILEANSKQFDLPHGLKVITIDNVPSASITYKNNKYKEIILRTGNAPAGNYTICVYVKLVNGNELGHDCKYQIVSIVSPPINISPVNGDTISEKNPQFTWLPPSPISSGQRINYDFKIVEILGSQSLSDAIKNNPVWFEKNDLMTNLFIYPVSAQNLISGKSYAWQVLAYLDGNYSGSSEIWKFTIKESTQSSLMSRQDAIDLIIKRIIVPQTLDHDVSVYLPMELTPPGAKVYSFHDEESNRTIENYSWFGWINDDPQAFFQHNTRFVFIDATTGKYEVVNQNWWPVVDNVSLWMSDEEKTNPEVLIYSDINLK